MISKRKLSDAFMPTASETLQLSADIQPMLRGHGPMVQGAVLADLVSIWLAGFWPREVREEILTDWIATMRKLIPHSEAPTNG